MHANKQLLVNIGPYTEILPVRNVYGQSNI